MSNVNKGSSPSKKREKVRIVPKPFVGAYFRSFSGLILGRKENLVDMAHYVFHLGKY